MQFYGKQLNNSEYIILVSSHMQSLLCVNCF